VGFSFGGQFRRETLSQDRDLLALDEDLFGDGTLPIANGGRKVFAFYAETNIPIFSAENAVTGFHALELKVAGRFEDWLNNDTNALVPDLGLKWEPFDESLVIRVNWQQGFREPSLEELYQTAHISTFPGSFDSPFGILRVTGNPDLQPEKSRSFNAGFSYSPKVIPGLTLGANVFDIEVIGRINPNPKLQPIVVRFITGQLLPGEFVITDPNTLQTTIQTFLRNEGREQARGIDMFADYDLPTAYGRFTSHTEATYLDSFRLAENAGDPALELSGRATDTLSNDGYVKWKGRSDLTWSWNSLNVTGTVRYTGGFREQVLSSVDLGNTAPGKFHWVDATWFFDVQASYDLNFVTPTETTPVAGYSKNAADVARGKDGKAVEIGQTANYSMPRWKNLLNNTTITVGCNNVFGEDPPAAIGLELGNVINYPGSLYDDTGRFVYARLTKKF
jgi:iron complex outermembrane receptor protein